MIKKWLFSLTLLFSLAFAQDGYNHYVVLQETAISSSAEVVTVQQPSTNSAFVQFEGVALYSSVALDFTIEQNGTAATSTAVTPTPLNGVSAALTKAFRLSNVGTGTVIGKYSVPAGGTIAIDTSSISQGGNSTGTNFTIRSASGTGTVRIIIQWKEK